MHSKFSFFQAPFLAFFSGDLYRDVASNWKGSGALYIFLLSSGAWVISALALFYPLTQLVGNPDLNAFFMQFPKIVIQDGKLSMDKKSPYEIKDPKSGAVMMVFATDRTGTDMYTTDPPIVVTQEGAIRRENDGDYEYAAANDDNKKEKVAGTTLMSFDKFSSLGPRFEIDGQGIISAMNQAVIIFPLVAIAVAWPFIFVGHLLQLLIYGGIAMFIANIMQKEIEFEKAMRLSAIAITPAVMISVAFAVVNAVTKNYGAPSWPIALASVPMAIVYLVVIMRSLPTHEVPASEAAH